MEREYAESAERIVGANYACKGVQKMKSILMSIKPKWVEKIASGEKTVEVRKTVPKCGTPFKVYMYCTNKSKNDDEWQFKPYLYLDWKKRIRWIDVAFESIFKCEFLHGKVVGEFVCDNVRKFEVQSHAYWYMMNKEILKQACLTEVELHDYIGAGNLAYGLHISDLKIYDKPKKITDFEYPCPRPSGVYNCYGCKYQEQISASKYGCNARVHRPPQSWCYVEVDK